MEFTFADIEFTYGSTAIEGNTLTLRETPLLIDEGVTPASSKPLRELHEVTHHHQAVDQILAWAGARYISAMDLADSGQPEASCQLRWECVERSLHLYLSL